MELKKRKRKAEKASESQIDNQVDTTKPTATFKPSGGRAYTLSIALPGSIILNAQTPELQAVLAGQIARALAVFCVDEVVIFNDGEKPKETEQETSHRNSYTGYTDPTYFLTHILSYLETPPNLRKTFFPMNPDLRHAGALPSLDMPHHLRRHEWCKYREGTTIAPSENHKTWSSKSTKIGHSKAKGMTYVETGLRKAVFVPSVIPPDTRLTVKFKDDESVLRDGPDEIMAAAVAPSMPREEDGYYWGYSTRSALSLSAVMTECPFDGGYDLSIGTSERGISLSDLKSREQAVPDFQHMIIVFGGVGGLEVAVNADEDLQRLGVKSPEALFDFWLNLCPGQGSKTIRTEEAVWVGLMGLRDLVQRKGIKSAV
ncbi:hypothetical protein ACLMJK_009061 [Lecanora helva]